MPIIASLFFSLVALLCFSGMLNKHEKRRKMLKRLQFQNDMGKGEQWKKHVRTATNQADAAIFCLAGWLFIGPLPGGGLTAGWHIVIPFMACFLASGILSVLASKHRKKARSLAADLGIDAGFGWLDETKKQPRHANAEDPVQQKDTRRSDQPEIPGKEGRRIIGVVVGMVAIALLLWGPFDGSWPASPAIRVGYLILVPITTWFILRWIWKAWQPAPIVERRLQRALAGAVAGILLVCAVDRARADSHVGNNHWIRTRDGMEAVGEDVVLPGPDWPGVVMLLAGSGYAFWLSISIGDSDRKG